MISKEMLLDKAEWEGDCLVWKRHINKSGYGSVWSDGKNRDVHRVSFEVHHGAIPAGMHVMHKCDNRACINPEHLAAGTRTQNMRDMIDKGRNAQVSGIAHPNAKLTDELVRQIRERYKPYDKANGSSAIAREYGISQPAVYAAVSGKTWKNA